MFRKMAIYSIKDLEQLTGIKAHTIRMWEKRYNIVTPERTDTNIRHYNEEQLKRLLNISLLNKNGQKISKLATLSDSELCKEVNKLNAECGDKSLQINQLVKAMINLDEAEFNHTLNKLIVKNGFEETIIEVVCPFLQQLGVLWQTGTINPLCKYFVSTILKQKIYAAYDKILISPNENAQTIVFALNEKEYHELSLLIGNYIAKRLGYNTVYVGQAVPYSNLCEIIERTKCDFFVTNFISPQDKKHIENYLERLSSDFPNLKILASGCDIQTKGNDLHKNVIQIHDSIMLKKRLKEFKITPY